MNSHPFRIRLPATNVNFPLVSIIRPRPLFAGLIACCLLPATLLGGEASAARPVPPDIVVIMADDLGYSDVGSYGSEIPTPELDALAKKGVRFTHFMNAARCCPTRAALLTGVYPHQAGVGHMNNPRPLPGYTGELRADVPTIAERLRAAGYGTYMVGKWHVSPTRAPGSPQSWPRARGFDRFYGTLTGGGNYFDPATLIRDDTPVSSRADPEYAVGEDYYYTDAISDHAVRYVRDHVSRRPEAPFLLYVAYTAPHFPLQAKPQDLAAHRDRYHVGYEAIRSARLAKQQRLGLIPPGVTLPPAVEPWPEDPDTRRWLIDAMTQYAAQTTAMDRGIGQIVAALRDADRLDRTLLVFLSDNGASSERLQRTTDFPVVDAPRIAPRPATAVLTETRPRYTRDGRVVKYDREGPSGGDDTFMIYGPGWAQVSNTPFRGAKHEIREGGIATPFIIHWPQGIPQELHGTLVADPAHVIDLAPTLLDVAGVPAATTPAMEGSTLRPLLAGVAPATPRIYFFEHEGNRGVRKGPWKLVAAGPAGPWELYDLTADRNEAHNLAAAQPERVTTMALAWQAWAERANVLPWPW